MTKPSKNKIFFWGHESYDAFPDTVIYDEKDLTTYAQLYVFYKLGRDVKTQITKHPANPSNTEKKKRSKTCYSLNAKTRNYYCQCQECAIHPDRAWFITFNKTPCNGWKMKKDPSFYEHINYSKQPNQPIWYFTTASRLANSPAFQQKITSRLEKSYPIQPIFSYKDIRDELQRQHEGFIIDVPCSKSYNLQKGISK